MANIEHFDLIIVGAGLSGIGAAHHFQEKCPGKSFAVLESREAMGGTWDLFRYPGIRSDSDMHTFGYNFKPWIGDKAITEGKSILAYINETARDGGIDQHIRYKHKVVGAEWSSEASRWTLTIEQDGDKAPLKLSCNFLSMCSGYYDYDNGYTPEFKGQDRFEGEIIHPQKWTEDIVHKDKNIIVIGSGATAVTLVPSLAETAAHVTMLQRSPTYVTSQPARDRIANFLRKILPEKMAYDLTRKKTIWLQGYFYRKARSQPVKIKNWLLKNVRKALGPDFDIDKHFTPSYNPWDERLCVVPDGDLFEALKGGKASVVTDEIDGFTQSGIKLKSGDELQADMIVTATGLNLVILGGTKLRVDGQDVDFTDCYAYEGMMFSDVPNLLLTVGYTNASWTLRSDLNAEFTCRLINYMDQLGKRQVTPRAPKDMKMGPWIDFGPGYIRRMVHLFPHQGDRDPWLNKQNYKRDRKVLGQHPLDDGHLQFSNPDQIGATKSAAE